MNFACNYAIARFLPYSETGEFVNVGVVLMSAEAQFFDFVLTRKRQRVTRFFQELDRRVYKIGLRYFREELGSLAATLRLQHWQRTNRPMNEYSLSVFNELVKPRESIFRFSPGRTTLAADPAMKLQELYDFYVERQFATKEHHETVMAHRLRQLFSEYNLAQFYKAETVGDETYEVTLPFVHERAGKPIKAVKPLNLDRETSTKIFEHGDLWINRVKRLKQIGRIPDEMLFTVDSPTRGHEQRNAFEQVCRELERENAKIVPFEDKAAVISFAKLA